MTRKYRYEDGWLHITKEFANRLGLVAAAYDYSQLERWDLIERKRPNGYFRITQKGRDFVEGKIRVKKYLWMYNNRVLKEETEKETAEISIREALEKDNEFNYEELMKENLQEGLF